MPHRILILGGGFAGVYTARHLQSLVKHDKNIQITLVNRNNYFVMTPLLFEAASGVLEPRHAVSPIRPLLERVRFVQAEIDRIDLDRKVVSSKLVQREPFDIEYDTLVLALGGVTNTRIIQGADRAMTFKTLADAIHLRNHTIQLFEQADVERDPARKKSLLTFIVIGAGFVGLELQGELAEFVHSLLKTYPNIHQGDLRFELIEAGPRVAPEFDDDLADYAADVLKRRGINIRVNTKVDRIDGDRLHLPGGQPIESQTIIVATGVTPAPILATLPLEKDKRGAILVEPTMRVKGHQNLWACGDCASIPSPFGKPYPPLAQHALREAKCLAHNIAAAITKTGKIKPFIYSNKGTLAALGHFKGVGKVYGIPVRGFIAWWIWRTYYLTRMPRWRRRIRIMLDWTAELFFGTDVVQLDLEREQERQQ